MNTTLADGAEQRLDAQIAEALFGQPGMSKMDVANRVRELRGDGPALLGPREGVQDERARFEAWALAECLSLHRYDSGPYSYDRTFSAWLAWQAALSAQPSPGGQDALREAAEFARSVLAEIYATYQVKIGPFASQAQLANVKLGAALAARQPVGDQHPDDVAVDAFAATMKAKMAEARAKGRGGWEDPTQCSGDDLTRMLRDHVEKGDPRDVANFCMMLHQRGEAIAARQPVGQITDTEIDARLNALYREMVDSGQHNGGMSGVAWDRAVYRMAASQLVGEPVAWYYGFSDTGEAGPVTFGGNPGAEAIAWAERHGHTLHYLYAAPPAQIVDLGELREMLVGWKNSDYPLSYEGQCAQRALDACIADLQALIDGKAVGK